MLLRTSLLAMAMLATIATLGGIPAAAADLGLVPAPGADTLGPCIAEPGSLWWNLVCVPCDLVQHLVFGQHNCH